MAKKRMFSLDIVDSDAFLDMPSSVRLLYYDLGMRADDDGVVNNPKKIMRITGASSDDMSVLISKKFIIPFDNGIIVIKHWKINNYIRSDRYTKTNYVDEISTLRLDSNSAYTSVENTEMLPDGIPVVDVDKNRLDKNRLGEGERKPDPPALGEFKNIHISYYQNWYLNERYDEPKRLLNHVSRIMANTGKDYQNHFAFIQKIAAEDKTKMGFEYIKTDKEIEAEIRASNPDMTIEEYINL